MNLKNLNCVFLIILTLSVILLPVLSGASIIGLGEEDNFADEDEFSIIHNFSAVGMIGAIRQMSTLLGLGMSIFALFVVYLGGRSKHRRFNDRTIDPASVLMAAFLKTALFRAVFNFLLFTPHPLHTYDSMICIFCPTLIPTLRRFKL
jgi:amino acid transporter